MTLNIAPLVLTPTQYVATGSAGLLYTVPVVAGLTGVIIKKASFANVTVAGVLLTLYRVAQGATPVTSNEVTVGVTVSNGVAPYIAQELTNMVLGPGDAIWGLAGSSNAITATLSGFSF